MSYCSPLPFWEVYVACALVGCSPNSLEPDGPPGPPPARAEGSVAGDTLIAVADAHLRSAAKNLNSGTSQAIPVKITVGEADTTRAIIKFDQAAIVAALGSRTLTGATLELPVKESGTDPGGNDIDVHRVLKPWTEAGVTWKCGEDLNTANVGADCPTTKWKMDGADMDAFVATRTARVHLNPSQTGVATFDVTSDVQAFLAGGSNHGWLVNAGSAMSRALFWSREATLKPFLVLSVTQGQGPADWPNVSQVPALDATKVVALPHSATQLYRTEVTMGFEPTVSDSQKVAIFTSLGLKVRGVTSQGIYFVRFADRGPTIEAYRAFSDSIRAQPGVRFVAPISFTRYEEEPSSRYPSDGPGQARADWFTGTNTTWAQRAIRLPLAWGCETGTYGGAGVAVGVLEWKHEKTHPEFAASSPVLWEPNDAVLANVPIQPRPQDTVLARILHGTQVVGTLAATGDNGSGVSGVIWKTSLHLYAMYSSGNRPTDIVTGFFEIANQVRQDGIRVLSVSADVNLDSALTQTEKESNVEEIAVSLRHLLAANPGLILVVASGNDRFKNTYAAYLQTPRPAALRSALLKVRGEAQHENRVLVVTGSQQNNAYWDSWYLSPGAGANFFLGSTDIVAPSQDIVTLDRWTGGAVPVTGATIAGTSLSAPMVAGVAAQLIAMDPTLTPAQVKDYILRGAQAHKVNLANGELTPPSPVAGAPETVYQLDAYGSLRLLSYEQRGSPLCGVEAQLEQVSGGNRLRIDRNTGPEYIAMQPEAQFITSFSVAQGGRLAGFSGYAQSGGPTAFRHQLEQGSWDSAGTVPGVDRMIFLERDTAYLTGESAAGGCNPVSHLRLRIESPDAARRVDRRVTSSLRASCSSSWGGEVLAGPSPVSPDGAWIYVPWVWDDTRASCPSVARGSGSYLFPTQGGAPAVLSEFSDSYSCDDTNVQPVTRDNGYVAWRGDAQEFYFGRTRYAGNSRTLGLQRYTVSGGVTSVGSQLSIGNLHLVHVAWDTEGGRIFTQEWVPDNEPCYQRIRSTANPSQVVGETSTILNYCGLGIFMAPLRRQPMIASAGPAWGSAAQLARALDHKGTRRISYPRQRVN